MLDIVEEDLLKKHLKSVTYLRLDGSVPAGQRHNLVQRFNNDCSIDLLLLTTQVGGLGLNLTGADTVRFFETNNNRIFMCIFNELYGYFFYQVIFVEHDWNPMRDLQVSRNASESCLCSIDIEAFKYSKKIPRLWTVLTELDKRKL